MSTNFKHIPYGIADFKQVRNEDLYLVDKTIFFEKMENAGHFLFLVREIGVPEDFFKFRLSQF